MLERFHERNKALFFIQIYKFYFFSLAGFTLFFATCLRVDEYFLCPNLVDSPVRLSDRFIHPIFVRPYYRLYYFTLSSIFLSWEIRPSFLPASPSIFSSTILPVCHFYFTLPFVYHLNDSPVRQSTYLRFYLPFGDHILHL